MHKISFSGNAYLILTTNENRSLVMLTELHFNQKIFKLLFSSIIQRRTKYEKLFIGCNYSEAYSPTLWIGIFQWIRNFSYVVPFNIAVHRKSLKKMNDVLLIFNVWWNTIQIYAVKFPRWKSFAFVKAKEIPILLLKAGWYIGNLTEVISRIKCLKKVFLDCSQFCTKNLKWPIYRLLK